MVLVMTQYLSLTDIHKPLLKWITKKLLIDHRYIAYKKLEKKLKLIFSKISVFYSVNFQFLNHFVI